MKIFTRFFVIGATVIAAFSQAKAQCPTCTPDLNCVSTDGYPAICPAELPAATAGVYYEDYLTFYLPPEINDPENGINATLLEITIASVTGMPFGMEFTLNDPDGTFYPSNGDNYGCATICGTPILPGVYDINIAINALVTVLGFEVEQSQSFFYTFVVNPGEQGNTGFAFDNAAGCGEVTTTFEALLNLPAITTYSWDFGNGETSDEQFPPAQVYSDPGDYTVSLTTTISDYFLNSLVISTLDGNWSGDIDDLFGSADVWFTLIDGDGNSVYNSSVVDDDNSPAWTGLNVGLSNPPYSIAFTDDDLISADDGLGTASISLAEGTINFNTGTGTTGTIQVSLGVITEVSNEEIITVFPIPDATFGVNGSLLIYSDPELTGFVWFLNGEPISNQFGPTLLMSEGGVYSCIVQNVYGCSNTSQELLYCPEILIVWSQVDNQLVAATGYSTYQWYFNGLPLPDETSNILDNPAPGNYSVEITTDYGCTTESNVLTVTVGIDETADNHALYLFPNPASTKVNVVFPYNVSNVSIELFDLVGHSVMRQIRSANSGTVELDITDLAPGLYMVVADGKISRLVKK